MQSAYRRLRLHQLDEVLKGFEPLGRLLRPHSGWVRTVRQALGMSTTQLAKRLGTSQQAVSKLERGERDGTATIASLTRAAQALNCKFVYALVPRKSLQDTLDQQARNIAKRRIHSVSHTMRLEAQGITPQLEEQRLHELETELRTRMPRYMWDEQP